MHQMYFTEQPMSAYPAQEGLDFGSTALMFSNKHFDPVAGSRLQSSFETNQPASVDYLPGRQQAARAAAE